jgi:hypothetical protein
MEVEPTNTFDEK